MQKTNKQRKITWNRQTGLVWAKQTKTTNVRVQEIVMTWLNNEYSLFLCWLKGTMWNFKQHLMVREQITKWMSNCIFWFSNIISLFSHQPFLIPRQNPKTSTRCTFWAEEDTTGSEWLPPLKWTSSLCQYNFLFPSKKIQSFFYKRPYAEKI